MKTNNRNLTKTMKNNRKSTKMKTIADNKQENEKLTDN